MSLNRCFLIKTHKKLLSYKINEANFRLSNKFNFMQQNFTSELLVKHLYHETNAIETKMVENALKSDKTAQQEFEQMQAAKYALNDNDGDEPNTSVINNILNYSKSTATELV